LKTIATLVSFFFIILPTQSVGMNWALEDESDQLYPPFSDSCTAEQFCSELDDEDSEIILPRKNEKRKPKRKRKRKRSGSQHSNEYSPPSSPSSKKTGQKRKRYEKEPANPDQPPRKKKRYELKNKTVDLQCYEQIEALKNYLSLRRKRKIENSNLPAKKTGKKRKSTKKQLSGAQKLRKRRKEILNDCEKRYNASAQYRKLGEERDRILKLILKEPS